MERRKFIKRTVAVSAAAGLGTVSFGKADPQAMSNNAKFNLKYAPNFNSFPEMAGTNPVDLIKFCNDQGFRAIFDNRLTNKEPALQEKIASELSRHNMDLGPFVLRAAEGGESMVYDDGESREKWKQGMYEAIETSKRTGAKTCPHCPRKTRYKTGDRLPDSQCN